MLTATARQPPSTTPDPTRATKVLHLITTYLEGNQLLVHNVKSATMVHTTTVPPPRGPAQEPSKHGHLIGGPTSPPPQARSPYHQS